MDPTSAKKMNGPLDFATKIAQDQWLFDESYFGNVVLGMNARIEMLQTMPEGVQMGPSGQYAHTFVALIQEVATGLP